MLGLTMNLFEKFNINKDSISPDMLNNIMNMVNNSNFQNSNTSTSEQPNNIDFETILKLKTIIDRMNIKDDPRSNLLQSLKPYLKESRKSKVDQYIQLMNMSRVIDIFPFSGGDKNSANK